MAGICRLYDVLNYHKIIEMGEETNGRKAPRQKREISTVIEAIRADGRCVC
jgi:hypothetical protein